MIKAAEYALSGLQSANRQIESAARNIAGAPEIDAAHSRIDAANGNQETQLDTNTGSPPQNPFGGDLTALQGEDSLTESLVSFKEASISYKANAKVLSSVQDLQQQLLEILA